MLLYCPALRNNGKLITAACCVWKVSNKTPDNTSRATIIGFSQRGIRFGRQDVSQYVARSASRRIIVTGHHSILINLICLPPAQATQALEE